MRTSWETRDAAKLIGTNPRRLMGWAEKGLLTPAVAGQGKGSRRLYSLAELVTGVALLALEHAVGARSALARRLHNAARADDLVEQLIAGGQNVLLFSGGLAQTGGIDDQTILWFVNENVRADSAVTIVPLKRPIAGLRQRLSATESPDWRAVWLRWFESKGLTRAEAEAEIESRLARLRAEQEEEAEEE